jgi:glycosyltransferase involved in cell wall biosynthesis
MRILYFHQYFNTPSGSGGTRSYEMAKYLVQQGHQVTMVYAKDVRLKSSLTTPYKNGKREGFFDGIKLIEFDLSYSNRFSLLKRTWVFLKYAFKSTRLVFTLEYDLLFATTTPLTAGIPGIVMKILRPSKKFIFEVRDLWPELPKAMGVIKNPILLWMMDKLEYLSYKFADGCIALSPGIKAGIEKRLLISKPVIMIPNGCDLELFYPGKTPKTLIPGINEHHFVAIFTGAHGFANGLDAVLNSAKELIRLGSGDKIRFVFIGDGNQKDRLVGRAKDEQLYNCIFLDPVPKTILLKYLQAADLGLMILENIPAFYYGTSPNKFFDYIAAGLPVLNNYPGWLSELINENNCGVVIPPANPSAFANTLIQIESNRDTLKTKSIQARKLAQDQFNRIELASKFESTLLQFFK